jgi:hypothetical protein
VFVENVFFLVIHTDILRIVYKLINYSYTIVMGLLYTVAALPSQFPEEQVPQQTDPQKLFSAGCGRTTSEQASI